MFFNSLQTSNYAWHAVNEILAIINGEEDVKSLGWEKVLLLGMSSVTNALSLICYFDGVSPPLCC